MSENDKEMLNGISISNSARRKYATFEAHYSHLRAQEGRVFSTDEIRKLPDTPSDHPLHKEWEIRKDTVERFVEYIAEKGSFRQALDVGCGNGFFSAILASRGMQVAGVDISLFELEQATKAFGIQNPSWHYLDLMEDDLPSAQYDLITFHASIQYFVDIRQILLRMLKHLSDGGEIHILESPFYKTGEEAEEARQRSVTHFLRVGAPGMNSHYHFHKWSDLTPFKYEILGQPGTFVGKLAGGRRSPFPWIVIRKS